MKSKQSKCSTAKIKNLFFNEKAKEYVKVVYAEDHTLEYLVAEDYVSTETMKISANDVYHLDTPKRIVSNIQNIKDNFTYDQKNKTYRIKTNIGQTLNYPRIWYSTNIENLEPVDDSEMIEALYLH